MVGESELIKWHVDERVFRLRFEEINGLVANRFRNDTGGLSVVKFMEMLTTEPDIDMIATLCFLADLQNDWDNADRNKLLEWVTYKSDFDFDEDDEDDEDADPEE